MHVLLKVALGAGAYAALAILMRAISPQQLRELMPRKA
jgi:hypothetical protein